MTLLTLVGEISFSSSLVFHHPDLCPFLSSFSSLSLFLLKIRMVTIHLVHRKHKHILIKCLFCFPCRYVGITITLTMYLCTSKEIRILNQIKFTFNIISLIFHPPNPPSLGSPDWVNECPISSWHQSAPPPKQLDSLCGMPNFLI